MPDSQILLALVIVAAIGMAAVILILRHERVDRDADEVGSPFAASTEGEKRCPKCGMGNLWTDRDCIACGSKLP